MTPPPEQALLKALLSNSFAPDSGIRFAALARFEGGLWSAGVNWEVMDRSFGSCAETSAMMNMASVAGPHAVAEIFLMGRAARGTFSSGRTFHPCAECRQSIGEMDGSGRAVIRRVPLSGPVKKPVRVRTLLPHPFVFHQYLDGVFKKPAVPPAPLFLRGLEHAEKLDERTVLGELKTAAARSFCPDGDYREGAIILTEEGRAYAGSAFATANFKGSKDALTAALAMMMSFDGAQKIREAWFLHGEHRRCYRGLPYLHRDMDDVLAFFGCRKLTVWSGGEKAVRKLRAGPGAFSPPQKRVPVPGKYRGGRS